MAASVSITCRHLPYPDFVPDTTARHSLQDLDENDVREVRNSMLVLERFLNIRNREP